MPYAVIDAGIVRAPSSGIIGGAGFIWTTGTIPANEASVVVTHNLGAVPSGYSLVDNNVYAVGQVYVERADILANTATIRIKDPQPVGADFMFGVIA